MGLVNSVTHRIHPHEVRPCFASLLGASQHLESNPLGIILNQKMERAMGFEPTTATLARWSSTGLSYARLKPNLGKNCNQLLLYPKEGANPDFLSQPGYSPFFDCLSVPSYGLLEGS
jgi:hypothetical protein